MMRISSLLRIAFAMIGAVIVGLGTYITANAVADLKDIRRAAALADAGGTAMSATVAMSLERSVVQVALAFDDPIPQAFRDIVTQQRNKADEGLAQAIAKVENADFLTTRAAYVSSVQTSLSNVASLRAEIDALLQLPKDQRNAKRAYELPFELKQQVVELKTANELLNNRVAVSTQVSGALQAIQTRAWEVREFGGRARTYFAIATLNEAAISDSERGVLAIDNARALEAWSAILKGGEDLAGIPSAILTEIATADALYFGEYIPLIERLENASIAATDGSRPAYEMTFEEFFGFSNAALGSMETLSQNAGIALAEYWQARESGAVMTAIGSGAFSVLSLAGLVFIYVLLSTRVIGLVCAATRILSQLADGNLDVKVRRNRRELVEIHELFSTVEAFRTALIDAKRLEKEAKEAAELQKQAELREAEQERERAAERSMQAEKENAAAQQNAERERRAVAEIASVVEACAAGDFSSRLSVDDKEGIFAEICDGMNRIGQAADKGLGAVLAALERIAAGDLSQKMPTEFQGVFADIATAMNETTDSLSKTVKEISTSATSMEGATHEIAAATQQLSRRSKSNSSSLAKTAEELSHATTSIRSAASAAATAGKAVKTIEDMAQSGNEVVRQTVGAMSEIKDSSDEIGKVLSLIDDIAFQTNLLALNAGVEAARAGAAGRGFAVVATEVRALARRSSEAASEIATLVGNASENVNRGVELVNSSGEALQKIVAGVEDASTKLKDIVDATNDTSTTISEISQSTQELDADTRQNSSVFNDTEAQVQKLNNVANKLTSSVGAFQLDTRKDERVTSRPKAG